MAKDSISLRQEPKAGRSLSRPADWLVPLGCARQGRDSCAPSFFVNLTPSPGEDWHPCCTKLRQGMWMGKPNDYRVCIPWCKLRVPTELDSVGLCVYHFTWSVEEACGEMHRQVALRTATAQRRAEMATYVSECALLLARVTSNLCLSDDLKRRILCTFLSLMNLRGTLERAPSGHAPEIRVPAPGLFPTPAVVPGWHNSESNANIRSQV
jgi:hypothetical protein